MSHWGRAIVFCAMLVNVGGVCRPLLADVLLGDPKTTLETALSEFDRALLAQKANPVEARKLFLSAAARLEAVIEHEGSAGKIEYNLGNCYLQAGKIGEAILHYRRAATSMPRDPLLAENLKEARSRRLTSIAPRGRSSLLRGLLFVHYDFSIAERRDIAIGCYVGFWLLLCIQLAWRHRLVTGATLLLALTAASLGASALVTDFSARNHPAGVVVAMDVAAYKGPGTTYQRRFEQPLQPGVEFTTQDRRGDWLNVELPDGKTGWIEASAARLITMSPP